MRKSLDETTLNILRDGTEKQLRKLEMPWPANEEEMLKIIRAVIYRSHDYGTCVYAMSIASEAAFNWAARSLGVTGFQASCADMDILRRTRQFKGGFQIVDYNNLLYPQYRDKFDSLTFESLLHEHKDELKKRASELLIANPNSHPKVKAHWERLIG